MDSNGITETNLEICMRLRTVLAIGLQLWIVAEIGRCGETNVDNAIARVKQAAIGKPLSPDQKATNFLSLLETFETPKEQGKIYAAVASLYAYKGPRYKERVAEFCKKALTFPLPSAQACEMEISLGEALAFGSINGPDDQSARLRTEALGAFLRGLCVLEGSLKYTEKKPLPLVQRTSVFFEDTNSAGYKKLVAKKQAQLKALQETEEQNELLDLKNVLKQKIIGLYSGFPDTADEVIVEGRKILRDEVLLQELVRSIREKHKAKPGKQIIAP